MKVITVEEVKSIVNAVGINEFFLQLIAQLKEDFSHWHDFKKIPRVATHVPEGVIELMPICDAQFYTFKYVNGHPNNPLHDKQTVVAFGCLADINSGYPLLLSEMTVLTAFRTAATAALAASYLAKKNSQKIGLIGTGAQGEFLALAHFAALGIEHIKYFDLDSKAMEKFSHNLKPYKLQLEACKGAAKTIADVDIVITATAARKNARVLENEWIYPGMHINGIGGDCPGKTELDPDILLRSKIVVEYLPQSSLEGEVQNLSAKKIYAELWELVTGEKNGRENPQEITLFDSVGFALEDYSILKLINRLSNELKIGSPANLIPESQNPKDLFRAVFGIF